MTVTASPTDEMIALNPIITAMTNAFAQAGVRWAVLWMPKGGLSSPRGDIDLLVHPGDEPKAFSILRQLGFVRNPRSSKAAHFIQYCADTDQWLWLHIVTTLAIGRRALPAEHALARVRTVEHLPCLETDVAFWALLWHCLGTKRDVPAHHRPALRWLAIGADPEGAAARLFAGAWTEPGVARELVAHVVQERWDVVDAFARSRTSIGCGQALIARVVRRMRSAEARLQRWRAMQGISVAVLGPDGAGKSTLVAALSETMPFPSRTIYMGLTGGAIRHVRRLRLPGVVFAAIACVIWSRYLRARYHQARGRLVVFDRYVYDAVAPHPAPGGAMRRFSRFLSGRLCPAPDLVLLLDAPGDVMYARKHAYDEATLEHWRQCFRTLSTRLRSLEILNATRDAEAVRIEAVAHVWTRYAQRWNRSGACRERDR